jgi:peptidoglycan/LPS O-acetylase OafA/YrhL
MPGNDSPAWYWLLASNLGATLKGRWLESPEGFSLAHFWSLAVEEQFYLLWPLLVRFLKRPVLGKLCLALLIVGPLAHFVLHFAGNPVGAYLFTPTRLHTLAAGAWLAIAFRHPTRWETLTRFAPWVAATAGAITVIGLLFPQNLSLVPFGPFLWGAVLILALSPGSRWMTALDRPLPRLFGKFSYGLYVWHYFANPWLKGPVYEKIARFTGHGSILSLAVFVIFAFGFSFAASLLSWWLLEKPCLALKRYFRYGAAPSRAALTDNFSRFSRDNLS